MATDFIGLTTKLEYEQGSTWAEVTGLLGCTPPNKTRGDVETTHLGLSDAHKTFRSGLADSGVLAFSAKYDTEVYADLFALFTGGDTIGWRVTYPDDETEVCDGYLHALTPPEITPEGLVTITGEVKLSGIATLS